MRIVSIDSSLGTQLLVVDVDPGSGPLTPTVLNRAERSDSRHHAESLGVMLSEALEATAVAERPLDAVVVATGPAPFTGLRAGIVTGRALGRARGVPVHGVPSTDAVARLALDGIAGGGGDAGDAGDATVLVVTDARRREVYAARYRALGPDDVERLDDLCVLAPDRAVELGDFDVVAGSGAVVHPGIAQGRETVVAPVSGDALAQVRIALARLGRAESGTVLPTEPHYLRHADVQMPSAPKRVR